MEEMMIQVPFAKVLELVRIEDKMKLRKHMATVLNEQTAEYVDQCDLGDSEVLNILFSHED